MIGGVVNISFFSENGMKISMNSMKSMNFINKKLIKIDKHNILKSHIKITF